MPKTLINITQQTIVQDIQRVLEQYPDHPQQQVFAHPDMRQALLVWVLNRIPNSFTLLESLEGQSVDSAEAFYCYDAKSCTEFVIRQGIQEVMVQERCKIERYLPEEENAGIAASHWFG